MSTPYRKPSELVAAPEGARSMEIYRPPSRFVSFAPLAALVGLVALFVGAMFVGIPAAVSPLLIPGAMVSYGAVLAVVFRRRRRVIPAMKTIFDAFALQNAGDLTGAADALDRAIPNLRTSLVYHSAAVAVRAGLCIQRGEFDAAIALLEPVEAAGGLKHWAVLGANTALHLIATAHALKGDLPRARDALASARASVGSVRQGLLVPADAIVAVRSGDPDRAVEIIERGWSHAEGVLNGPQLRALHLIDAFACALANHEASDVQQAIAGARPFRPGEYRALASQWPELRDFIEKHGLS